MELSCLQCHGTFIYLQLLVITCNCVSDYELFCDANISFACFKLSLTVYMNCDIIVIIYVLLS